MSINAISVKTRTHLRATYRVQLTPAFDFPAATHLTAYLDDLGISHLYCSPYLQATHGSKHGYDVVNYHLVNQELGGEEAREQLVQALRLRGMSQVMDIVPNHMAITGHDNPWWWDVLANGPASRYAGYFDVDWDGTDARQSNAILLPVLGDHYGRVLEAGEICLVFDGHFFTIQYYDHRFPVDPRSVSLVLSSAVDVLSETSANGSHDHSASHQLSFLAGAFGRLPEATLTDRASARRRYQDAVVLNNLLARLCSEEASVKTAIDQAVLALNQDIDSLDIFLNLQNYRLAFWRISSGELGYRRFFDINSMIGLKMEDELVYLDSHARVFEWLADGSIDGLRIDHPDGLRDPQEYFTRLRQADPDAWIVIEKILEMEERMPTAWPVHGTTGYDFLNRVNGLFVDPQAEQVLTDTYKKFTGQSADYQTLVHDKKLFAARQLLGSDLERLTALFQLICERNRRYRDYTRYDLRAVLAETAACLPIYRTYTRPAEGQPSEADTQYVEQAIEAAKSQRTDLDADLFDFLGDLLLLHVTGEIESELVQRFQQFSGPVMAKGVEDTTFYIYNRFVSLNEVGGNPGQFGFSIADFHRACQETARHWPYSMLATSTHDTKRGEDVRARLNVISEYPERWMEAVQRWNLNNNRYRQEVTTPDGRTQRWPDRNTIYLLYQTMVGAWPLEEERALAYMEKAAREAKVHTSWLDPNPQYEETLAAFIHSIYADKRFITDLEAYASTLYEAGWVNGLSQTLLKLTTPGIPDIYQGSDLWNLSLVDPDNRRPVDYDMRRALLSELKDDTKPEDIWAKAAEGLPKLWVIRQALKLRRKLPNSFGPKGDYTPVLIPDNLAIAYMRADDVLVVVPRFAQKFRNLWPNTIVKLPSGPWRNVFTHEEFIDGSFPLSALLGRFPVALLERSE